MSVPRTLTTLLLVAATLAATAVAAHADDEPTAPQPVPLAEPPSPKHVPVPDVRGLTESEARKALTEAGLTCGGIEKVGVDHLERAFGRRYVVDTVVQQAPPASAEDKPSWLQRGSAVFLRLAVPAGQDRTLPGTAPMPGATPTPPPVRVPAIPTRVTPTRPPATTYYPEVTFPRAAGPTPPRPPPPYPLEGSPARPARPAPRTYVPTTPAPATPPTRIQTQAAPSRATNRGCGYTLACERREEGWHAVFVGGAALWVGSGAGSPGAYAGIDLGYRTCNCWGIDVFYRYAGGTFDRTLPSGLLEDSGDWHHVGLKGTYERSFDKNSRLFWWTGFRRGLLQDPALQRRRRRHRVLRRVRPRLHAQQLRAAAARAQRARHEHHPWHRERRRSQRDGNRLDARADALDRLRLLGRFAPTLRGHGRDARLPAARDHPPQARRRGARALRRSTPS